MCASNPFNNLCSEKGLVTSLQKWVFINARCVQILPTSQLNLDGSGFIILYFSCVKPSFSLDFLIKIILRAYFCVSFNFFILENLFCIAFTIIFSTLGAITISFSKEFVLRLKIILI